MIGRLRRTRGFTLLEMLVVVAIIAILMGLLLPVLAAARRHSRKVATKSTIHNLQIGLDNYRMDWGIYPIQPGGSNVIWDDGGGSYPPGYYQVDCVAKGSQANLGAPDEDNIGLTFILTDLQFLDVKKENVQGGYLMDYFSVPIVSRFLILSPTTVTGDTDKLSEKVYIWSYGPDNINHVDADTSFSNAAAPTYDAATKTTLEASPTGAQDDVTNWK
ncbi:MAG: type II secretion system GspH family protein [Planctomycetota bacterium]|nr:type II secretion system GspH family protein [Planctomycetota bacterium]